MSCRLPVPWPLAAVLVPLRSRNSITLLICHFTASFQCESLPGIGVEHELFSLLNTTFEGTPHTDLEDLESVTEKVSDCWTASYGLRFRDHETNRGWQIFALHATRSERWLAVGPAWDRALGVPLFPETWVGADKWRVGGCIVDRGPRICAGYHHPARPTDWTHFLVSKRKKTPRGEEGVERRYAAASDLQGFVQGRSEDSDSQLQER